MAHKDFFDMKATEAGFNLNNKNEEALVKALRDLVYDVFHGEDVVTEYLYPMSVDVNQYDTIEDAIEKAVMANENLYTGLYKYNYKDECFILDLEDNEIDLFQIIYFLNMFGIELLYRNGEYRVYIKK